MKVIFLDIDGVLNSKQYQDTGQGLDYGQSQIDPQAVKLLNALVRETGASIVISSSWRHIWSRGEIVRMLMRRGFEFPKSVIGVTPSLPGHRGQEIEQWLGERGEAGRIGGESVDGYVIIDDTADFNPEQYEHFVQTNPDVGLTEQDVRHAISVLGM